MIYTSYFGNLKKIPSFIIPVSICGKAPEWWHGYEYKKLSPKYSFFMKWKETHDNNYYVKHFEEEVLNQLNADEVIKELNDLTQNISDAYDICLICYEKPEDFCHRHLVAEWLNKNGYDCKEFILEKKGD